MSQRMPSSVSAGHAVLGHVARPTRRAARAATSWCRHAVHASTSDCTRSGCSTPMICAITPPIDAPTMWARSMPARVEHLDRVARHAHEVVRARAARRSGRCRGCRSRCSGGGDRTRRVAAPSRARSCRGPGSSAPANRRAGPTRRTRCARRRSVTISLTVTAYVSVRLRRAAPTPRRAPPRRSARPRAGRRVVGIGAASRASRSAPATDASASAERTAGRDRDGDDRHVRHRLHQRPRRDARARRATTWARAGPRRDARRAGTRAGRARSR